MATIRTYEERIEALDKKQEQLKAQKKALQAKMRTQERKARTKHLIEVGAEVERICKITDMAAFRRYLEQYRGAIRRTQPQEPSGVGESIAPDIFTGSDLR